MGKPITIAGVVGFGSLIAGVGAPEVIEGMPYWANAALFIFGTVLIVGAFIAHLLSGEGSDNARSVAQTSQGPSSPNVLGDGNKVAIGDGTGIMRDDNQKGNFNYGTNFGGQHYYEAPQISPQHALKRDLRDLLAAADGRILFEIDRGNLNIETRMTELQFERLKHIAATSGSASLIEKADLTERIERSLINNGSFGPTTAEEIQFRVKFLFCEELMQ